MGCHFLLQGNPPNPGIEPGSPILQADSLPSEPPGKPRLPEETDKKQVTKEFVLAAPLGMWDLSSLTRDHTSAPFDGSTVLTLDCEGSSPKNLINYFKFNKVDGH